MINCWLPLHAFPFTVAVHVAHWVRALGSQAEGLVFESQPRHTYVVKTGSDSSTAKRLAIGVSVTGPRRYDHYKWMPRVTGVPSISKNLQLFTGNGDESI